MPTLCFISNPNSWANVLDSANWFELLNGINGSFFTDQGGINCGVGSPSNFSFFFGSQDIWIMPVWRAHFWGFPYLGRHMETTSGEKNQRQDRQKWHLNLTFRTLVLRVEQLSLFLRCFYVICITFSIALLNTKTMISWRITMVGSLRRSVFADD